jgi:hypothetical protein
MTATGNARRLLLGRQFSSAQIEDHDATLGGIVFTRLGDRSLRFLRKLEPGLLELVTPTLFLLAPPDLIDDERRKHQGLTFGAKAARHN